MKAFTTLMKIAITAVSIALVVMLVTSVMPLVMGGVDIKTDEKLQINYDLAAVDITGKYTVVTSIEQDISDLTIEAYLLSRDGSMRKDLIKPVGPVTLTKENPDVAIVIDESIPIAEVALFFVTDNMDKDTPGLVLPVTIRVTGTYSNNLAGIDMAVTYDMPLSQTGSFSMTTPTLAEDGEISKAELTLSGFEETSMIADIIPAAGVDFSVTIGGREVSLAIDKDGDDIKLDVETGDLSGTSILSVVDEIMEAVKNGSDETIEFEFVDGNGDPTVYSFSPADVYSENPEIAEKAEEYSAQIEGISASLAEFLVKFAALGVPA